MKKEMKIDKKNYRNWQNGDTFAIKVKDKDNKYGIKYWVLNLVEFDYFKEEQRKCDILFRVKALKDDNIKTSYEDIESLEYVKTMLFSKHNAYEVLGDKPDYIKVVPDEYDFIYTYQVNLYTTNRKHKVPDDLIYLGNYQLTPPVDEYIPWSFHCIPFKFWNGLEKMLLDEYGLLNKKEHVLYDKEKAYLYNQQELEIRLVGEAFLKDIRSNPEKYEYLCKDVKRGSLTYVGNEWDKK